MQGYNYQQFHDEEVERPQRMDTLSQQATHPNYPDARFAVHVQQPVVHQQPSVIAYNTTMTPRWSWCNMVTSIVAVFFCFWLGFIATIISLLSYSDHKTKYYTGADRKKRIAYCLSITGIIIGICVIGVCIFLVANAKNYYND